MGISLKMVSKMVVLLVVIVSALPQGNGSVRETRSTKRHGSVGETRGTQRIGSALGSLEAQKYHLNIRFCCDYVPYCCPPNPICCPALKAL
ncbi:hypothetical protein SESBI_48736 [Sesbania bispinosa]|nr:hypothetical protein SESBI_48736 [Sesbania bispinosa]